MKKLVAGGRRWRNSRKLGATQEEGETSNSQDIIAYGYCLSRINSKSFAWSGIADGFRIGGRTERRKRIQQQRANGQAFRRRTWTSCRGLLWFPAARSDTRRRAARLRRRGAARRRLRGAERDGTWPCRSRADREC